MARRDDAVTNPAPARGSALHRALDTMPQMVWSTRPDGHHDYFNRRWYEFTGVPQGSTDGAGWNGIFHPDEQDLAWERWRHSLATGELYEIEYRLRRHDGVYRWVLGRAMPVRDAEGRIERWYGTCTDIDDLKAVEQRLNRSEKRFRSLVEATDAVVWTARPDGGFDTEQPRWTAFTGQPFEALKGWGWLAAVHPDDRSLTAQIWSKALLTRSLYAVEHRLRRRDGVYRSMLVRATPLVGADGEVEEWVGIHTDVTGLKDAEASLRRLNETLETKVERRTTELVRARTALEAANRDLEGAVRARTADLQQANEEIKRFAYIVGHDLRAPLVNIMGFTSELETARDELGRFYAKARETAPDLASPSLDALFREEFDEAIGFIRSSTEKMDRLINAILTLSRAERRVLTPEPVAMAAFLAQVKAGVAHQAAAVGATIDIDPAVPDIVSDRLALEQVFANLVENAVKYLSPERPGRIRLSGRPDGDRVVYTVKDNGRGIEEKDFERVFELFRRAGVQDKPGEGIGLAHVRALVRKLGGRITVASIHGEGSTFTLDLPRRIADQFQSS
ncbi:sensor histidine kinase [Chthonobacter rhizosphaerae]|uniref:sensor histidine kinase n=1 Tax=Chthonobacter rhizosphaerae TaxID=2735553 RepID=UPI0015EF8221|nr:PAS domain-containing sensor histidine kinase [Chthonobacter rhizosphaerae]